MSTRLEPTLFIGGPKDGEILTVDRSLTTITFAVPSRAVGKAAYERIFYHALKWKGSRKGFILYVSGDLTPDQVLELLIARYAKVDYNTLFPLKKETE